MSFEGKRLEEGCDWEESCCQDIQAPLFHKIQILHSECSLHFFMSVWSKESFWDECLKGMDMNMSGEQMQGRKNNLIWIIAQEQMENKQSLSECGWKWEKGFQQEIWNSLWVRIDVKTNKQTNKNPTKPNEIRKPKQPSPLSPHKNPHKPKPTTKQNKNHFMRLISAWSREEKKVKNWLMETEFGIKLARFFPQHTFLFSSFLRLLLWHLLESAMALNSSLAQSAVEHALPAWFNSSWFPWHPAGHTLYLRGQDCSTILNNMSIK